MAKSYSTNQTISSFFDHRAFLAAVIDDLRAQGVFSHRVFNSDCGFSSPNFVQLVIQGKRNLSDAAAKGICKTIGLSKTDTVLFMKMRDVNIETDPQVRFELLQDLLRQPAFVSRYELSQAQLSFYSKWYNVPVRELLQSHPHLSAKEIGEALIPEVPTEQIEKSLLEMVELGLIESTSDGWRVRHQQIATGNEVLHQAIAFYHSSMIDLARESLGRFKGAEREVSAMTLQLTEEEFLVLREKIRDFKKEALAAEKPTSAARVFQFNFQLFPVTKKIKGQEL